MPAERKRLRSVDGWLLLGVASVGLLAALALPFAPVLADRTTLTWPAAGRGVESTDVQLTPYRPTDLSATVPCTAVAAALADESPTTVLATAPDADGLVLRTEGGRLRLLPGGAEIGLGPNGSACALTVHASAAGIEIGGSTTTPVVLPEPVPKVIAFRTELSPTDAAGMTATVHVDSPFATRPTAIKQALAVLAILAAALSLVLLRRTSRPEAPRAPPTDAATPSSRWRLRAVDAGVVVLLCGWAMIGPLAVDDGWAATIARTFADTGNPGNYYRWWNAPESPFAFSQELLAPLTQVSLAPLWLRLPSTLLAITTWFVLSRGVLGAALPSLAGTARVRMLAALFFVAAWLPFNLGTRPESYVAVGMAAVLALTWRARSPTDLGWIVLVCALTAPISPTAVMLGAPVLACLPRAGKILRDNARGRVHLVGLVALLCCVGAVALVVVFVDQTWEGLATATRWHTDFGPSLPWYREPDRYAYLLEHSQQGSFAKRAPVLFALTLAAVAALVARRVRGAAASASLRLSGILIGALALLALVPSKWSYHLGGAAPLLAAVLTVGVVAVWETASARLPDRRDVAVAAIGAVVVAAAAAWTFTGPNAWWLPYLYDVPWANRSIRPLGVPLDSFWLWLALGVAGFTVCAALRNRHVLLAIPSLLAVLAVGLSVAILVGSFVIAPIRRPEASLAMVNAHRLASGPYCGLADSIEVLADGDPLPAIGPPGPLSGFVAMGGFDPAAPPLDAPGAGTSAQIWGSRTGVRDNVGQLVSPWFVLPADTAVSVSVSGRTDGPNALTLEFGRADGTAVTGIGAVAPADPPQPDDNAPHPAWRTIGVDAAQIPLGADRVRIRATDGGTTRDDWLAVTGPRTTNTVPLSDFLAGRSPTLVGWPLGFVFPCVHDIASVAGGVTQMPRVILAAPGPWFTETSDQYLGGTFAAVVPYGRFHEVRSRVVGHPELRWGAVLVSPEPAGGGLDESHTVRETPWGFGALPRATSTY